MEEKKAKAAKPAKEKKVKKEEEKRRRHFPFGLILLLLIIIAAGVLYLYVDNDVHKTPSDFRGTVIDGNYCFYLEDKDTIISYSTSKGPRPITAEDPEYAEYKEQLRPANVIVDRTNHIDDVSKVMGDAFDQASYRYIDDQGGNVLFSHAYNGKTALWLYTGKTRQVDMLIDDPNIVGIAYSNDVLYARDNSVNETRCYRVSTSYSRQLISVEPFASITSNRISFWSMMMLDLTKGIIRGFKASRDIQ